MFHNILACRELNKYKITSLNLIINNKQTKSENFLFENFHQNKKSQLFPEFLPFP